MISLKVPASANPIKLHTHPKVIKNAKNFFIFSHCDGAGAGFEPVCDLARPRSPFEPPLMGFLELNRGKGLGFPKALPVLKVKGVN
jgi:hypothetical protein